MATVAQLQNLHGQVTEMRNELDGTIATLSAKLDSAEVGFKAEQARLNKKFDDAEANWSSEQARMEGLVDNVMRASANLTAEKVDGLHQALLDQDGRDAVRAEHFNQFVRQSEHLNTIAIGEITSEISTIRGRITEIVVSGRGGGSDGGRDEGAAPRGGPRYNSIRIPPINSYKLDVFYNNEMVLFSSGVMSWTRRLAACGWVSTSFCMISATTRRRFPSSASSTCARNTGS